jgi:hypothetical protein
MKARPLRWALLALLVFPACSPELREEAAAQAANRVAEAIPSNVHLRLLAIAPVAGDTDGRLERALVSRLSADPRFRVVEREQQDALLEEQSRQLSAAVSPESRVELGRMLGAEGLLLAEVLSSGPGFLAQRLQVHFRLDDLQRGTVAAAEQDITVEAAVPYRNEISGVLIVLVLGGVAVGVLISRRELWRLRRGWRQRSRLTAAQHEVRETRRRLEETRTDAVGEGESARALRIDDAVRALRDLEQCFDHVPAAIPQMRRSLLEKDAAKTCQASRELALAIRGGDPGALERCAAEVERLAAEAVGHTR